MLVSLRLAEKQNLNQLTVIILIPAAVFIGFILLYKSSEKIKNERGERMLFNRTRMYAIQIRMERLFSKIHTRSD